MSDALEKIVTEIPGPRSFELADLLRSHEPRGVTYLHADFPVFWESGRDALITDVDGNRFIDCTGAFGVATTGHANASVAHAIAEQAARLPHAMGDVHPSPLKAQLVAKLAELVPIDNPQSYLCSSGTEAVEFALKTASLATGEPNVLAFGGAYHGVSLGTLEICGLPKFRAPFKKMLKGTTRFAPFPTARQPNSADRTLAAVAKTLRKHRTIGALIVEPIQGRAGVIVPPEGFLRDLRALCRDFDVLLIVDEIYTGLGRTGDMFAFEREGIRPDIVCIGKALGGGVPIAAAVMARNVAEAWPASQGEALHTSTFLGNPIGCAAALANLAEIKRLEIPRIAREREATLADRMLPLLRYNNIVDVRGRGMLWAIEFKAPGSARVLVTQALQHGVLLLQSGLKGESVTFAPPPIIGPAQLKHACEVFTGIAHALAIP